MQTDQSFNYQVGASCIKDIRYFLAGPQGESVEAESVQDEREWDTEELGGQPEDNAQQTEQLVGKSC